MAYSETEKEKYLQYYQTERDAGRTPKKFGVWLKTRRRLNQAYDTLNTRASQTQLSRNATDEEIARFRR